MSKEKSNEEIMGEFSKEVMEEYENKFKENQLRMTPIFIGWCLCKGIDFDRAYKIDSKLRYEHQYKFSRSDKDE